MVAAEEEAVAAEEAVVQEDHRTLKTRKEAVEAAAEQGRLEAGQSQMGSEHQVYHPQKRRSLAAHSTEHTAAAAVPAVSSMT